MHLRSFISLSLSLASFISLSNAAISVAINNSGSSGVYVLSDASGNPLPSGSIIRVGYFVNEATNLPIISGNNYNALNSIFRPLGEGLANGGTAVADPIAIGTTAGRYVETVTDITGSYFNSTTPQLYIIATNALSLNSTPTQWAVFTNNDGTSPWIAPEDIAGEVIPVIFRATTANVDDANDLARGTYANVGGVSQIRLAPVPEPTTLASVLLGGLALLRRRRVS
jgi:hypothetical protein